MSEFYRATLGADAGYRGVLSSNGQIHTDYQTSYPWAEPYALGDLADVDPEGLARPACPDVQPRAATWICSGRSARLALGGSDDGLATWARTLQNREFTVPLADAEVRGVVASVLPLPGTLARRRAHARALALETGRTGAQGRAYRWVQRLAWRPVVVRRQDRGHR